MPLFPPKMCEMNDKVSDYEQRIRNAKMNKAQLFPSRMCILVEKANTSITIWAQMWQILWIGHKQWEVLGRQRLILTRGLKNFQEMEIEIDHKEWIQEDLLWCEHRKEIQDKGSRDNIKKMRETLLYFKLQRIRIVHLERTLKFTYFVSPQITFLVTLNVRVFVGGVDKVENILLQKLIFSANGHF